MKGTRTKLTIAVLLALMLISAFALPAQADDGIIVVKKYIRADIGGFLNGGGITVVIPPKALPYNATITMSVNKAKREVGFSPDMNFNRKVLVRFSFNVTRFAWWSNSTWVNMPLTGRTAVLSHFSRYAWW